jgi:uncharacterized protein YndB with AHSA1/START domain
MPYDFKLSAIIPASPQEIYDAWLDSLVHSEMTRSEAIMSDEIGGEVSAWGGYITGRNLELVPGERIVQSWRTTEFADEHEDSIITVMLEDVDGGTLLTLVHSNVPQGQTSYEEGGWQEYYFEPMKEYFAKAKRAGIARKAKASAAKTKAKRAAMMTKAKRGPAPKARAAASKKKPKRAVAAKAKPKRATRAKAKPARGATRRR